MKGVGDKYGSAILCGKSNRKRPGSRLLHEKNRNG